MSITDNYYDDRAQDIAKPIPKLAALLTHDSISGQQAIVGTTNFVGNGLVKQVKYQIPNLATDTDFTINITDQDGAIFSIPSVPDNFPTTPGVYRVPEDVAPLLCSGKNGKYTIDLVFGNNQTISADTVKIWLFLSNH